MTLAAVLISCSALIFSIGSFYWLQARKGRLKLFPVVAFSASASAERFRLRLPITIYNTGAKPRVVVAVRLRLLGSSPDFYLECHNYRKTIDGNEKDFEDAPAPYVVPGRNVVTKFPHFHADTVRGLLGNEGEPCRFDLQALLDDKPDWISMGEIEVHTQIIHTSAFISYSNNAGVWPKDLLNLAAAHRDSLEPLPQA